MHHTVLTHSACRFENIRRELGWLQSEQHVRVGDKVSQSRHGLLHCKPWSQRRLSYRKNATGNFQLIQPWRQCLRNAGDIELRIVEVTRSWQAHLNCLDDTICFMPVSA